MIAIKQFVAEYVDLIAPPQRRALRLFARCFTFRVPPRTPGTLSNRRQTKLRGKTMFDNGASFFAFVLFPDTRARLLRGF